MAEYIEREALDRAICRNRKHFKDESDFNQIGIIVMTAPTADVVEVRHGRFVDWGGNPVESFDYCGRACDTWGRALYRPIHCSECHICLAGMNGKLYPHQRNYCPNCGAKMGGKGDIE